MRTVATSALVAVAVAAGCGSGGRGGAGSPQVPSPPPPVTVTVGTAAEPEGTLELLAPPGAFPQSLLARFTRLAGCLVVPVSTTRPGGAAAALAAQRARADVVAVRSDGAGELIDDGSVAALDPHALPTLSELAPVFRRPDASTVDGTLYGVAYGWSAEALLTARGSFPDGPPTSWRLLYDTSLRGRLAVPDTALQVAAAARFLGYRNPFSLDDGQLAAARRLLLLQRPLVRLYSNTRQLAALLAGGRVVAAAGPAAAARLARGVHATIPEEGTIGWTRTLLVAAHAPHPLCAYAFLAFVMRPGVQAQLALADGGAPTNPAACEQRAAVCTVLDPRAHAGMLSHVSFAAPPSGTGTGLAGFDDVWSAARAAGG